VTVRQIPKAAHQTRAASWPRPPFPLT
jgi:hypothetical protein